MAIRLKEGFKNQIQYVIPQAVLGRVKNHPLLQSLMVTDIGWYPQARYHYRERDEGAAEHILIMCEAGSGWCNIDGQYHRVEASQALLIPKGHAHSYGAQEKTPWTIHWVHFTGSTGDYLIHLLPSTTQILPVDPAAADGAAHLFQACYHTLEDGFSEQRLLYCAQVLHHLLGVVFFHNQYFSTGPPVTRPPSIETALQYLQENISRSLTLADIAHTAGLSVAHFSTLFKQQMSYSPLDYFIHIKIQRACFLLDTTTLSVREIGSQVGYEDPYYFSRIFRKVMGVPPRAYRQSRRTA
ncbi:MAG: AraC family transcriptional regulator [Anaerolineae bacterium]|nr:AraC family transcriptional regulator [Anaerolineae bacterium]MCB0225849.1 AraC family transcriptional regulator [Anaerolineae bacterium]